MRRFSDGSRRFPDDGAVALSAESLRPDPHGPEPEWLSISELAHRCGVSTRSLRYYEEQGLLAPERNTAGHRRYASKAAGFVRLIQHLYNAGIPSDLIRTLVQDWQLPDSAPRVEAILRTRHAELASELEQQRTTLANLEAILDIVTESR
jgi:DNA-binding transcriptional MerR regulator